MPPRPVFGPACCARLKAFVEAACTCLHLDLHLHLDL